MDAWDLGTAEDLQAQEFELGGTQWRIKKLLPMEAKRLFIRHVFPMMSAAQQIDLKASTPEAIAIHIMTSAKPENLEAMSAVFANLCIYYRNDQGKMVGFGSDVEKASENLLPIDLLMLDIRAFAVNFGESVSKLVESLQRRIQEADEMNNQWPPTPSSSQESTPDSSPLQTSRKGRRKATRT